jgi:hypothetical protein
MDWTEYYALLKPAMHSEHLLNEEDKEEDELFKPTINVDKEAFVSLLFKN